MKMTRWMAGLVAGLVLGGSFALSQSETVQGELKQLARVWDGTDVVLISSSGELAVIATAQPGVDIGDVTLNNTSVEVTQGVGGASAWKVDGSAVTQPVSGTVTVGTFPDNEPINLAQVAGAATATGNGTAAGSVRVALASDGTGQLSTVTTVGTVTNLTNLPNEGTQTAANSISVTVASDIATGATTQPTGAAQGLVVRQPASCTGRTAISQIADTQVVTGTGGSYIYVCAIHLIAAAAETINIIEGTGTTCATSPAALYGSTTESNGMAIAANGGFAATSGQPFIRTQTTGTNLCITQVGANRIAGTISYIVAP